MIKKTTTFALGMIFSIGLCTVSMPLHAKKGILSDSNKGANIVETLQKGFTRVLKGETTAHFVVNDLTEIDKELGDLINALLKYLVEEFKKDSTLVHDEERCKTLIKNFCIKKLGLAKALRHSGTLQLLAKKFATYSPEDFCRVIYTINDKSIDISLEGKENILAGVQHSLELVRKDR
jgi:hypothetical protein